MSTRNEFFANTTYEQRRRIIANKRNLSNQGFFPWWKTPFGFDKVYPSCWSTPTLALNRDGKALLDAAVLIREGDICSRKSLAQFMTSALGREITVQQACNALRNPTYKGMRMTKNGLVKGAFAAPMTEQEFQAVQDAMATWKLSR